MSVAVSSANEEESLSLRALALFGGLALLFRGVNLIPVFFSGSPEGTLLVGTDPYYHTRRIHAIASAFPSLPGFDPYLGHPEGAFCPYEPGFDFLLGTLCRLLLGAAPEASDVRTLCAAVMPLLGLPLLVLMGSVATRLGNARAGGLTLAALAILPGAAFPAQFGQVDHHVLEPLVVGLPMLLTLNALNRPRELRALALAGSSLGIGLVFWRGVLLPAAILALFFGLRQVKSASAGQEPPTAPLAGLVFFAAAALFALPIGALSPTPDRLSYFTVSLLQGVTLGLIALGFGLMGALQRVVSRRLGGLPRPLKETSLLLVLGAVGLLPLALAVSSSPHFADNLLAGLGFLAREETFVLAVGEQRPLFANDGGGFSLLYPVYFYSALFLLAPYFIYQALRSRTRAFEDTLMLFLLWSLVVLGLGAVQRRYAVLLAPVWAVWLGLGLEALLKTLKGAGRLKQGAVAALGTLLLLPTLAYTALQAVVPVQETALLDAMRWIREHTPETRGFLLASTPETPEYAVVAPWEEGHHLIALGHRANVANPFGIAWFRPGLLRVAHFFLADGGEAEHELEAAGARYALLSFRLELLRDEARFLGRDPERFARIVNGVVEPGPDFATTAAARLYLEDGLRQGSLPPVPGLRLVYEGGLSDEASPMRRFTGPGHPVYKLFERVPGAVLESTACPGSTLTLSQEVVTNTGRHFTWRLETPADRSGRWSARLVYANSSVPDGRTQGIGALLVAGRFPRFSSQEGGRSGVELAAPASCTEERMVPIAVPREAVLQGRAIGLPAPATP